MIRRRSATQFACLLLLALLAGCTGERPFPSAGEAAIEAPPAGAGFDYQLGGNYPPPEDAQIVVRQWDAEPAEGLYSICYVNAFQTEAGGPDRPAAWPEGTVWEEADDPDWPGEHPIDISTEEKRRSAAEFVTTRFEECASGGFDAVELDNLDSYARYSDAPFDRDDTIAYATLLADAASRLGLAVGQKNAVELGDAAREVGFSFAIVEECGEYDECRDYVKIYGNLVYAVEYGSEGFSAACTAVNGDYAVILRDRGLTAPGEPGYIRDLC